MMIADWTLRTTAIAAVLVATPVSAAGLRDWVVEAEAPDARVTERGGVIDIDTPIFTKQKPAPADGLTPDKLVTNEFIDKSIGLPKS